MNQDEKSNSSANVSSDVDIPYSVLVILDGGVVEIHDEGSRNNALDRARLLDLEDLLSRDPQRLRRSYRCVRKDMADRFC